MYNPLLDESKIPTLAHFTLKPLVTTYAFVGCFLRNFKSVAYKQCYDEIDKLLSQIGYYIHYVLTISVVN